MTNLTPTQREVLELAAGRSDLRIFPMPERLNTILVQQKVFDSLLAKGFIDEESVAFNAGHATISPAGLAAIGREPDDCIPAAEAPNDDGAADDGVAAVEETVAGLVARAKTPREGTKKALLAAMLSSPEGATLAELETALAPWLTKTIRGTMSTLKHKERLNVVSGVEEGRRVYRII